MTDHQVDAWAERAAILEFDAGMSRIEAEREAARMVGIKGAHLPWVMGALRERESVIYSNGEE